LELSLAVLPQKGELKIPDYCMLEQPDKATAQKPPSKPNVPVKVVEKKKSPQNYSQEKCAFRCRGRQPRVGLAGLFQKAPLLS